MPELREDPASEVDVVACPGRQLQIRAQEGADLTDFRRLSCQSGSRHSDERGASEPRDRPTFAPQALRRVRRSFSEGGSEPAQRRARARVGEFEGQSPSNENGGAGNTFPALGNGYRRG